VPTGGQRHEAHTVRRCCGRIALGGIVTAAPAVAEPRCGFQGDWDCDGPPQYNGPLQNTWSHGLTTIPQICPGGANMQPCSFYVPQP
jgi:hypothetical protein